eukprot:458123-Amphidinium_carterae.1
MADAMEHFAVCDAKLTHPEDRQYILRTIRSLFGSVVAFEGYVHADLLRTLHLAMGPAWRIPYTWGIFACQPYLWYMSTDSFSTGDVLAAAQGCRDWNQYAQMQ